MGVGRAGSSETAPSASATMATPCAQTSPASTCRMTAHTTSGCPACAARCVRVSVGFCMLLFSFDGDVVIIVGIMECFSETFLPSFEDI